jgi:predicted GH43/DUF377 family glycosyl hydrolase
MSRAAAVALAFWFLSACGRYRDFTLPLQSGGQAVSWRFEALPAPVLPRGASGEWDSSDALNPSVVRFRGQLVNLYSGFDGKTWHTGLAVSRDGIAWTKRGVILSPDASSWEGDYIAANGSAIVKDGELLYYYQAGRTARIGLAVSSSGSDWRKRAGPVLSTGPYGSWDEQGAADPCVIQANGKWYMFYCGMDRAKRQRLGVAMSVDGIAWYKLRSNPVLELGEYGSFDEAGLGEPAVWAARGYYWLLYTGRDRNRYRRLGIARSTDGVRWERLPDVFKGDRPWDAAVLCDATLLPENGKVRVWFGGGDIPGLDEKIDGQIGAGEMTAAGETIR